MQMGNTLLKIAKFRSISPACLDILHRRCYAFRDQLVNIVQIHEEGTAMAQIRIHVLHCGKIGVAPNRRRAHSGAGRQRRTRGG